ncbi:hypothetical protein QBC38DRAFT_38251 [Podospora fimiseda]|uniref:CCHC-type domain-containing protein n=1 Tax=Podospora fimiseda TaxID=252190 RepID=A0AAN7BHU6_9PEZI|nr:hypothetical protein QBC38DRAFT_38251 [Podospora fimiseda]
MSSTAPGQSGSQSEAECYNCGARGHWMVACPEPARERPAGLQRAAKQQQDRNGRSEKAGSSHDRRGPVVTRYPVPPPPTVQPIPGYNQSVPPTYAHGPPPGLPPPPSNPPPPPPSDHAQGYQPPAHAQNYPLPPPPSAHGQGYPPPAHGQTYPPPHHAAHGQHYQAPPPSAHDQGYAPPPNYPPPAFTGGYQAPPPQYAHGQYNGSVAPAPPPAQYGQQYGQPQYGASYPPPGNYYPNATPAPPPQYAGNPYPQQYNAQPPPPPPGSVPYAAPQQYSSQVPPPPSDFQYPPAQPTGFIPPPPGMPYPAPAASWNQPAFVPPSVHVSGTKQGQNNNNNNNRGKRNHGNKRNRDRNRDRDRNANDTPSKGSEGQRRQQQDQQRDRQGQDRKQNRQKNQQDQQKKEAPAVDQSEKQTKKKDAEKPAPRKEKEKKDEGEFDFCSEKDLKLVFPDTPEVHPADPVGIPLPFEYTEDPTIPPAYNATCIKSAYFNEYDLTDFVRSIRDSKAWPRLKEDPVFQMYPGMITRQFPPDRHEYPTYEKVEPPSPTATIKMPPKYEVDRKVLEERLRQKELAAAAPRPVSPAVVRERHQESPRDRRGWDGAGRDGRRSAKRAYDAERGRDNSRDFKRARRGDSRERSRGWAASPSRRRSLSPPRRRRSPSPRYDLDADPWAPQAGETIFPPNPRNDSGYQSGDGGVRRSASRSSPDRSYGRLSSTSDRGRSRTRSPSPLTAMEAGLLGMAGSDDEAVEEKKTAAKKPVKRPQVAAAYRNRRW